MNSVGLLTWTIGVTVSVEILKVSEEGKPREFSRQRWQDCVELWVADRHCSGSVLSQDLLKVTKTQLRSVESSWVISSWQRPLESPGNWGMNIDLSLSCTWHQAGLSVFKCIFNTLEEAEGSRPLYLQQQSVMGFEVKLVLFPQQIWEYLHGVP